MNGSGIGCVAPSVGCLFAVVKHLVMLVLVSLSGIGQAHAQTMTPGSIVAWGDSAYGQCNAPALPAGLYYESVAGGWEHSLALRSDGAVVAWGGNEFGVCNVPSLPSGLRYESIAAFESTCLALRSDGSVVVWGNNGAGQFNVPSLPSGLRYESVAGGPSTASRCAVTGP